MSKAPDSHSAFRYAWPAWLVLAAACFRLASPDVPLGMAWGRAIVESGGLPATNVFSHMNPERLVLLDKWLFQLTTYLIHGATGTWGLVLLRVGLLLLALWAAGRVARLRWNWTPHALLGVLAALALLNRCYVRAELVTWAAIPLTLCLVPLVARGEKKGWALLLLVQAVWANSHGYWVIGPMLWAAVAAGACLQLRLAPTEARTRPERMRLLIATGVALLASCLTPYGPRTVAHPIRLAMELQNDAILKAAVDDFGTPLEAIRRGGTLPFWACYALGLGGIFAAIFLYRRRRLKGEALAVFLLGLLLGLPYYRNSTILALCALPIVAAALRLRLTGEPKPWRHAWAAIPASLCVVLAFSGWGPASDYGTRRPGFGWHKDRYPIVAANWIARNAPDAKLWNEFSVGGWLNWRLGEGRTFIDGNTDGYSMAFLEQYNNAWSKNEIVPWLNRSNGCTVALIDYGSDVGALVRFLNGVSWFETPAFGYVDAGYCVLFANSAAPADSQLTAAFWGKISERVQNSELAEFYSPAALNAVPANAAEDKFARSRRLLRWLYP
ncbi:MAG: hypothetical protein ACI8W8_002034 [Rhodothermales bacterium]|jgi:hypothetical protein